MNIQMIPWVESHVVNMDDYYTRLKIKRQINAPIGLKDENESDIKENEDIDYKQYP